MAVLLTTLARGLLLIALIPPFQTPDEYGHYDYALYLAHSDLGRWVRGGFDTPVRLSAVAFTTRETYFLADITGQRPHLEHATIVRERPPIALQFARARGWTEEDTPERLAQVRQWHTLFNYPPLYHVLQAAVHRALRAFRVDVLACFYAARLLSLLLFTCGVAAAWRLCRALRAPRLLAVTTAAVLALHPQLAQLSVSVQPDNLSFLLVTLALVLLARAAGTRTTSVWIASGASVGLVLLTKSHLAVPLAASLVVLAASQMIRHQWNWIAALVRLGAAAATALAIGGWWYLRSWLLFGNWAGLVRVNAPGGHTTVAANLSEWFTSSLPLTFRSYWGVWGWLDYGLPPWVLPILAAASVFPALTWILARRSAPPAEPAVAGWAPRADGPEEIAGPVLTVATATVLFSVEMIVIGAVMGSVQNQGRHWLPFAAPQMLYFCSPVALLGANGIRERHRSRRRYPAVWRTTLAVIGVLTCWSSVAALTKAFPSGLLQVRMSVTGDSYAESFIDSGAGFNTAERAGIPVRERDGLTWIVLPIESRRVLRVRFDPLVGSGRAQITAARVVDPSGAMVRTIDVTSTRALHGVQVIPAAAGGGVTAITTPGSSDPSVELPLDGALTLSGTRLSTLLDPFRALRLRVERRVPFTSALAFLWATMLMTTVMLATPLLRAGVRLRPAATSAHVAGRVLAFCYIAGCATLTAWLTIETLWFYW